MAKVKTPQVEQEIVETKEEAQPVVKQEAHVPPYEWVDGDIVHILMPTNRSPHIGVLKAFASLYERDKMKLSTLQSNFVIRGRNQLADQFLTDGCKWALFWDDDIVPPHGDIPWFKQFCGNRDFPSSFIDMNPIQRLISSGKKLISGCYFGRHLNGRAQFAEGMVNNMANDVAHSGPRNLVAETMWVPMGFTLIHREVFIDIINKLGDEVKVKNPETIKRVGYRYRFFNTVSDETEADNSEDVAFCSRALRAGHKSHIDFAVVPAHVGACAYSYHNTRNTPLTY